MPHYSGWQFTFFRLALGIAGLALVLVEVEVSWIQLLLSLSLLALTLGVLRPWASLSVAALWLWEMEWSRNLELEIGPLVILLIWASLLLAPPGEPLSLLRSKSSLQPHKKWLLPLGPYRWLGALWFAVVFLNGLKSSPWLGRSFVEAVDYFILLPQKGASAIFWLAPVLWFFRSTRPLAWLMLFGLFMAYLILGVGTLSGSWAGASLLSLVFMLYLFDSRWLGARQSQSPPILFFDGVCGLCNRCVDWALKEDWQQRLLFAPLQGDRAAEVLDEELRKNLDSLVLWVDGKVYLRSTAALLLAEHIGGIWRLAAVLRLIPRPFRDFVYDRIAQSRYQWFGRLETCRLPSLEERGRILK